MGGAWEARPPGSAPGAATPTAVPEAAARRSVRPRFRGSWRSRDGDGGAARAARAGASGHGRRAGRLRGWSRAGVLPPLPRGTSRAPGRAPRLLRPGAVPSPAAGPGGRAWGWREQRGAPGEGPPQDPGRGILDPPSPGPGAPTLQDT